MQAEEQFNMANLSLKLLFESQKGELEQKLTGLRLPQDATKIQQIVSDCITNMLEIDGAFRQKLTQSEDFILQATISVLKVQENYLNGLMSFTLTDPKQEQPTDSMASAYYTLIGTGVGSVAGSLFGIWASVIGALVGNAIAAYTLTRKNTSTNSTQNSPNNSGQTIDVAMFINIISNICSSIDNVINTFRTQVNRMKNDYENIEKPSFQTEHAYLLEQIANVSKIAESMDDTPKKLKQAISLMVNSLENYGLKIENGQIINQ